MQPHIILKPGTITGVTVSTTAVTLTTPGTDTVGAILVVESNDVRMRWDGDDPASGVGGGQLMKKDSIWEVTGRDILTAMKFIRVSADAYVSVSEIKGW
jgi:hypothetical protein